MAKKLHPIEKQMLSAQKKMGVNNKKDAKEKTPKKRKTVKEQYEEIKESMKPKVKEINSENELVKELFNIVDEIDEVVEKPINNHKDGLWDFVLEDEITFFDPLCSYELTGYKPINNKDGLDFDPTPFREAAILYETTGQYSAYSKDSKPYIDFWNEQKRRCREGYEVKGYRIPGDFYFFLNFYRLPVAKEENGRSFVEENFPVFTTEHYKWFHYVELCELLQRDVCALKSRGVGWSEIAASLSVRPFITERNYTSIYTAFNSTFLDGVLDKCWYQLNWLNHHTNYGMYRARGKYDNAYHKRASKVDKEGNEYGRFANIIGIVADNPRKIRGERCARLFYEESGSQPHLSTGWVQGEALITRGGRRVGSRFAWGCVCAGTKVYKNNGEECLIENLKQEDGILGFKNGRVNKEQITYWQDESYKECVRITTDLGILECSVDHPLYKRCFKNKRIGKKRKIEQYYKFVEAGKILPDKRYPAIAICDKIDVWGNDTLFDPYLVGLLIGDGSYGVNKTPRLSNCDFEVNNYIFNNYDTSVEKYCKTKNGCDYYETRIKNIRTQLVHIGIAGQTKTKKRLPAIYKQLNKEHAQLLLAGLFDTDGYISNTRMEVSITQSTEEILKEIQWLLRKFGIFGHIAKINPRIAPDRKDKNPYYTFTIRDKQSIYNFKQSIPIKIQRKIDALDRMCKNISNDYSNGIRNAYVKSVESIGIQRIYNLTANDSHTYLANDFITHNTGGDSDSKALDGLSKMFNNPDAYNILPYKHNFTEDGETVLTAFFLPAYAMVIDPKYMDHRGYTDMVKAREYFEAERKKKSGQVLLDYCAEYCFTGSEALLKQGDSIFDTIAIADRLTQIRVQKIGIKPQVVDLQWDCPNADINPRNKVKMIPNQFGKVKIYEPPVRDDDGNPYRNLYIAGIDSIDQGTGDSSTQSDVSDFCIVIKKRVHGSSMPNYVAIYKDRPKDIVTAYENAMKLLVMYNCKAMLEHTKISIIMHFRSKKMDKLLMQRPKSTLSDIRKGNSTMIGYPATETYLKHGLDLINTFVNESCYSIHIDEMLEQLLKYSWENKRKFDIIAAMIAAELGDEDLMGFTPKVSNAIANEWRDFGWYVDTYGNKRYGIIPK